MTLHLYLHKPAVVMAARVDLDGGDPIYPQHLINFDTVTTGAYTDLRPGMTVLFGSAAGADDLGRNRIARISEDFPTFQLEMGRFSQGTNDGEVTLVDNSYITVLDDYRVWAKIPRMLGAVIRKDGDVASFENVDRPPPVANGGAGTAGNVDGTGYLNVTFDGTNSWAFSTSADPPIVGATDYLWDIGDGTLVSGTLTSSTMTAKFPRGFRYVTLTVTGGDEDMTHTCQIPIFARDAAWVSDLSISDFQITSHLHTLVGQEITVNFFTPLPRAEYPDGTLVMVWDDDVTYDPETRLHMIFIGWHQNDAADVRADDRATLHSTQMTFYDVNRRLETLPGFSQIVTYNASPTLWTQTKFPNVLYFFWYILYWHSTAIEVADLLIDMAQVLASMEYVTLGSDRANLYTQVNSIAALISPDHRLTCSRQGQMRLVVDPQIQNTSDRESTFWDHLTDADWTNISYNYVRPPRVHQIRTKALVSSHEYVMVGDVPTIEVIACVAPGDAQGQGEQDLENYERIAGSQFSLNVTEGNRYARANARYGQFSIELPYEKMYFGLDLSVPYWVSLTISEDNVTERDLPATFSGKRGQIMQMSITYDYQATGLIRTATLTWEMETSGQPAQTVTLWPDVPEEA